MLLRFCLYRSKNKNEVIQAGTIKFNIENDDHLARIDDIIINMLGDYISTIPEIQKFGTAYIGREEIMDITITDEDNVNLSENAFRHYMSTVMPKLAIIWNKTTTDTNNEIKPDKTESRVDNKE